MPTYRFYFLKEDGHSAVLPATAECANDEEAVSRAAHFNHRHGIEIWFADRMVKRIEGSEPQTP